MRSLIALLAAGLIAMPVVPEAADSAPPRPAPAPAARAAPSGARVAPAPSARVAPGAPPSPTGSAAVRPAPPPRAGTVSPGVRPAPAPGSARYGPSYGYPHHPYYPYYPYYPYSGYYPYYPYWGFGIGVGVGLGWGWGYPDYPYYPDYSPYAYPPYAYPPYAPSPPPAYAPPREAPPVRLTTLLSFQGGAYSGAAAGALAIAVDGPRFGFQGSIGGVGEDKLRGFPGDDDAIVSWGIAHATWSFLAADRYRVRLEAGASMLYMPDSNAFVGQPYAGTVAVGPSFGVSGHARIVGPLGIEGHARVTPLPVPVADTRLAAALRGGPLAITAGWRAVDVSGDGVDGPQIRYSGPELGLSFWF